MSTADRRAELLEELAQLDAKDAKRAALSPAQRVADALHEKRCWFNHTDGCSWHYGDWGNPSASDSVRDDYLAKAKKFLDILNNDEDTALRAIAVI